MSAAPDRARLFAAVDGTWPAAAMIEAGPWTLREGRGGGKRVSAASLRGAWHEDDIAAAEKAMRLLGQEPLFMIRPDADGAQGALDTALDAALQARGYQVVDPVHIRLCPLAALTDRALPPVTAFTIWEPLEIMYEIWQQGGIGPARFAVMERVRGPRTAVFGRLTDQPAAVGFAAVHDGIAMVHALEVLPAHRGKGLGRWMMRAAALWAAGAGAEWMAVLCTRQNVAANALYAGLGMAVVGDYHYRMPGTAAPAQTPGALPGTEEPGEGAPR